MKSSLKKLRDFALHKHGSKEKISTGYSEPTKEPKELIKGMQDVEDMRAQYEGLLTAAQIISSSAFDFSIALQEMAFYMVESFGQIGEGEIGNIFSMLGKVQYEVSKLLDLYAAHVSQTLISPVESLLTELQHVEDMKGQYDEKRQFYNNVREQKQKFKSKNGKADATDQRLLTAKEELDELALALGFRLQSLKKGRMLSLITQAVRYHTAQRNLFSKGIASVDAVEPLAKQLAHEHNIDRALSEGHTGVHVHEDGDEINRDVPDNDDESESVASSPRSVQANETQESTEEHEETRKTLKNWVGDSKSAPISPSLYNQTDVNLNIREVALDTPVRKYALPSPSGPIESWNSQVSSTFCFQPNMHSQGLWPSAVSVKSDLHVKQGSEPSQSGVCTSTPDYSLELKETFDSVNPPRQVHQNDLSLPPAKEFQGLKAIQNNADSNTLSKADRRYSHSGPLTTKKTWTGHKLVTVNNSGLLAHQVDPLSMSGPVSRSPMTRAFASPRISPSVSPPHLPPPRISELHKLPPPPPKSLPIVAHSAPLRRQNQEPSLKSGLASALPPPPPSLVTRSLSIPSSADNAKNSQAAKGWDFPAQPPIEYRPLSPPVQPAILPTASRSEAQALTQSNSNQGVLG